MNYEEVNAAHAVSERDPFTEDRYRQFARHLRSGAVLDVGCNTGRGGQVLAGRFTVTGLDAVRARIDQLPDCYAEGIYGVSTAIPVSDESYDAVVAGEFLEHLRPPDVDATLAEFFRVLKIGGRLLLTTPNPDSLKLKLKGGTVLGHAHVSQHFPSVLKLRLKMAGFSGVRLLGSGKSSRYLGERFPLWAYGSYLAIGDKR